MTMMQASVLRAVHDLILDERPVPQPGPREVLVQVKSVGVRLRCALLRARPDRRACAS